MSAGKTRQKLADKHSLWLMHKHLDPDSGAAPPISMIATTERFGYEYVGTSANAFYGIVSAAMGNLDKGVGIIREQIRTHRKRGKGQ
jgi:hypothetical protein